MMIETLSMEELSLKLFDDVKQVEGGNGVMVKHSSTVVVDREDDTPVVVTISVETPDFALDELEDKFESASVRLDDLKDALNVVKENSKPELLKFAEFLNKNADDIIETPLNEVKNKAWWKEWSRMQTFKDDPVKPHKVYFVRFNPQTFVEELLSEHQCRCRE